MMMTTSDSKIVLLDDGVDHLSALLQYLYGETISVQDCQTICTQHTNK